MSTLPRDESSEVIAARRAAEYEGRLGKKSVQYAPIRYALNRAFSLL